MARSPLAFVAALALLALAALPGCIVHARARPAPAPEVVVFGPAVHVHGPVRHLHDHHCGHAARWHGGRYLYFVDGHWEYVDGGRLYVYRTVRSSPASVVVHEHRPKPKKAKAKHHGRSRGSVRETEDSDDDDDRVQRVRPSH